MKFIDASEALKEDLKNPAFKKAWDALDAEFAPIHAAIRKQIRDNAAWDKATKNVRSRKVTVLSA